jgi:hypothetical protein
LLFFHSACFVAFSSCCQRPAPAAQVLPIVNESSEKQIITTVNETSELKPTPRRRRYVNPLSALELLKFPNIQLVVVFVAFM